MLETILASYGASYLILGYIELMDTALSYLDKKIDDMDKERRQELEKTIRDVVKMLDDLEQAEKQIKELEK